MKEILRRISLLAAVIVCLVSSYAWEVGVNYSLNENDWTATVIAGDKKYSGDVVIPADVEYEGNEYRVTAIGDWALLLAPV